MKFLKSLFSFTIPLIVVLIIYMMYSVMSSLVANYKQNIIKDYAIIVVTEEPVKLKDIEKEIDFNIQKLEDLNREEIIQKLKGELSKNSLDLLKQQLPFFYKIHLDDYPTKSQLATIKSNLEKIVTIKRIETFSSDHSKIYSLLLVNEQSFKIMLIFIMLFAIFILTKQVEIWFFEHDKRISIFQYYGGSIFYGAIPIIRLAAISFVLSSLIAIAISIFILNNMDAVFSPEILSIIPKDFKMQIDYLGIFGLSFLVSSISIIGVLLKHKTK